ncbi:plasmid maintenance system killer family protein [Klebsiella oxytoca]|uniref:plasmid maintenance system killer family protein n=1 Tax=Klebsiella oxytoca TaxID=571 RepID=UPI0032DA32AE
MMSLWDALRMNMMISYQELVRTFPNSLKRALNELHAAGSEADLIRLKSRNYEKIHHTRLRERERAGDMSSIRVSSKYRLLFTWANGGANRVKLTAHAHA